MISRFFLALLLSTTSIIPAYADEKLSPELIGNALDTYGVAHGLWLINLKCSVLNTRDRQMFEYHRNRINEFVYSNFTTQVFAPIRISAEKVAKEAKYSKCETKQKDLVPEAVLRATKLSKVLPDFVPFSDGAYKDYLSHRIKRILTMFIVEQKCKMLPKTVRPKLGLALQFSLQKLTPILTKARLLNLSSIAKYESVNSEAWNCGKPATNLYAIRLPDFRDFVATLKLVGS